MSTMKMTGNKNRRVLVVAAHPDDEVLGPGATIAKHSHVGDTVQIAIAAQGATSRANKESGTAEFVDELRETAKKASSALGALPPIFFEFPDNAMDGITLLQICQKVEELVESFQPSVVYTHHGGDLNIDHELIHRAVLTATRPLPGSCVKSVYTYETVSSTEWFAPHQQFQFRPTRFVDVSNSFDKKLEALKIYSKEMREFPHARSHEAVAALATFRGANSGFYKAEAFSVVRELID